MTATYLLQNHFCPAGFQFRLSPLHKCINDSFVPLSIYDCHLLSLANDRLAVRCLSKHKGEGLQTLPKVPSTAHCKGDDFLML